MKKLTLNVDALEVQSFEMDDSRDTVGAAMLLTNPNVCITGSPCGDSEVRACRDF